MNSFISTVQCSSQVWMQIDPFVCGSDLDPNHLFWMLMHVNSAKFFDNASSSDEGRKINFDRKRFGSVLDVVPLADSVMKLTARCEICGRRASFTLRKTNETQTELIGGADVYMPVCRQHYVDGGC